MKAVIQRVKSASVSSQGQPAGKIEIGLLIYIGVGIEDDENDMNYLADKIPKLRIFPDADDKMNCSLEDVKGAILAVSQFTLQGDCRKGRRPSFTGVAEPTIANEYYQQLVLRWQEMGIHTETGVFQTDMLVESVNWGPVTFILDSKEKKGK
ncbi:MAG: D-aminoacyl-tRNA deacylase [Clostridiales bacterium]